MTIPDFLHLLRRRTLLILSVTLICGVISLAVTAFILPHEYTAYATFCVRNRSDYGDGITSADLAACESLTEPCIALITGSETMALAARELDGMSDEELRGMLEFEDMGAGVFRMSVSGRDSEQTRLIALKITETATLRIPAALNAGSLSVIDGVTVTQNSRPVARGIFLGLIAGFAGSVCLAFIFSLRKKENA